MNSKNQNQNNNQKQSVDENQNKNQIQDNNHNPSNNQNQFNNLNQNNAPHQMNYLNQFNNPYQMNNLNQFNNPYQFNFQQQQPFQNLNNFVNYNFFINQNINYLNNNIQNSYMNNNIQISQINAKPFNIIEMEKEIFIENINQFNCIKILKDNSNKIEIINKNDIPNNPTKKTQADAIIGFFNFNNIKYLGIVANSEESAMILTSKIYLIKSIELIKITNNNESPYNLSLKENIKNLFATKNFYYSNDYKLSLILSQHNQYNINEKYLMNYSLLKIFFENNIPQCFYSQIIFGFVLGKNNISLGNNQLNIALDIIIIERYLNGNINMNNSNLVYIKQIEFITIFKNMNNIIANKKFSHICYESSESINNIKVFVPFKIALVEELNQFKNIVCILNNLTKDIKSKQFIDVITKYNKNLLNNKIGITNFSNEWKNELFEGLNIENQLDCYSDNTINQQNVFWFIDINNNNFDNNRCNEALKSLFWKMIQKEINIQILNINIGILSKKNTNIICKKYFELTDFYENSIDIYKRLLFLNKDKEIFQEILDKYLNTHNISLNKENKIENEENKNTNKTKILCITWNVGGYPLKDNDDISEIFTHNHFYASGQSPDIIIISIQEIVDLNTKNILNSKNNQEAIEIWNNKLKASLNNIFPEQIYINPIYLDLVGLYVILFVKQDVLLKIIFNDFSEDKKGKFSLGNKGYFTFSFKYMDKIFSVASGHLESGSKKNLKRIKTLKEILNKKINVDSDNIHNFKDADFWIILGDLNFRIELSYENAISLIQEKNFTALYCMDQFHLAYEDERNQFLKDNINEGTINFGPTYKFEKNSDNYDYDNEKIRVPAWCDRIFFCKKNSIKNLSYDSVPNLKMSDHRPVTAAFEVYFEKENEIDKSKILNDWVLINEK